MDSNIGFGETPYEYEELESLFLTAVDAMSKGDEKKAAQSFRQVLEKDPRLPEPRLELAVILYRQGDLGEAEQQIRFALEQIEHGWQWLDNFEPSQLHAHALILLGTILIEGLTQGTQDVVGDRDVSAWVEAESAFKKALELDPENQDARAALAGFKANRKR